jgi:glycosyltransferase 2 family protein
LFAVGKLVLAAVIIAAVGRRFYLDLQDIDIDALALRPAWLMLSGSLYIAGLGFSAALWRRLLCAFGQRPGLFATVRAYYVGQLGKYVPGKAWALLLRSALLRGPEVHMGIAAITGFYEVLTSMGAGLLVAICISIFEPPAIPGLKWKPIYSGLLLLSLLGLPLVPAIFNRLVSRMAVRFRALDVPEFSSLRTSMLAEGLLLTSTGWLFMGGGLWASLQAVLPEPPGFTPELGLRCVAALSLAYVAGFLAVVLPGGIGVREVVLRELLIGLAPPAHITLGVLVLRLIWTVADVLMAGVLYVLPLLPKLASSAKKE